jgi:hypothetical protein
LRTIFFENQKTKKKKVSKKCLLKEMRIKEEFENDFKNLLMLKFQKRFLMACQKRFRNS